MKTGSTQAGGSAVSTKDETYEKRLNMFEDYMDKVYGTFREGDGGWRPKAYADNKSRYLWTDAFGVCNYITLYFENGGKTGELRKGSRRADYKTYLDQADALINEVHNVLGKTRNGARRLGASTDDHPLRGGLRIGKVDPEGTPDGDGQYFHYLTKWMFALNRMSLARKDPKYNNMAVELAEAVHDKFIRTRLGEPHLCWKMTIDLSKPAVSSEGNLDPYDGYVTYKLLQEVYVNKVVLQRQIGDMHKMIQSRFTGYRSSDLLDLGETLWLTHFYPDEEWCALLTTRAYNALRALYKYRDQLTEHRRLLFRECGTIMGLSAHPNLASDPLFLDWIRQVQFNSGYDFDDEECDRDITPVMLCTCLNIGVFKHDYLPLLQK